MPHELTHEQNRVVIVKSVITKIFNPSKYWMVTIQPFWKTLFCSVPVLFIASLIVIVPFSVLFNSVLYVRFGAFVRWLYYSVYFLFWYWKCIPGILIPLYNHHQAVNKTSYSRQCHLCLSIGIERPIIIIDIEGYPEPVSPYGLADSETLLFAV
jgi:hypothetical protein